VRQYEVKITRNIVAILGKNGAIVIYKLTTTGKVANGRFSVACFVKSQFRDI